MTTQSRILEVARTIRADAWVDFAANGAFSVGFADNRDAEGYNAAAGSAAASLKAAGFRVKVRPGNAHWPFAVVTVRA